MLDRLVLALQSGQPESSGGEGWGAAERPIRINLGGPDHWLGGLVKSWATVADVLTFYQERILHEGFLPTAVEERSVHELVQMIGYRRRPGVAGSTELAIKISEVQGLPQELSLPERLVVRSVPPPGSEPLIFETREALEARAAWNLLRPGAVNRELPPLVTGSLRSLEVLGTTNGLGVGGAVYLAGTLEGRRHRYLRLLTAVRLESGEPPRTRIDWAEELAPDLPDETIHDPEAHVLRQQAGLFGHNAPRWQDLPAEMRNQMQVLGGGVLIPDENGWPSRNQGLPAGATVQCLLFDDQGNLFAGTANDGIFRSLDGGKSWSPARRGLLQTDVQALALGPEGTLFAGTAAGGVYRSTDRGEIWEGASGGIQLVVPRRSWLSRRGPTAGPLPQTTVRSLAFASFGGRPLLFAGTDNGIYRTPDSGRSWLSSNQGLPGTDPKTGGTDVAVRALAAPPGEKTIFAGTARGVYRSDDGGARWAGANRGLPATDPFSAVSGTEVHDLVAYRDRRRNVLVLVAATGRGLFRSADGGKGWQRAEEGLGVPGAAGTLPKVNALAVVDDPITRVVRVYAGTPSGLWSSLDHGASWSRVEIGDPIPVHALGLGAGGRSVIAATPFTGFARDWPAFRMAPGRIDLDSVVPGVVAGSWVALRSGSDAGPAPAVFPVLRASTLQRRDFSLVATVTRLEVDDPQGLLAAFDLRDTRAFLVSEPLALRPRLVPSTAVSLGILRGALQSMGDGSRRVIVTGKTLPWRLTLEAQGDEVAPAAASLASTLATLGPEEELAVRVWIGSPDGAPPDVAKTIKVQELSELLAVIAASRRSSGSMQRMFGVGGADVASEPGKLLPARLKMRVDILPKAEGRVLTAGELARCLELTWRRDVPGEGADGEAEVVKVAADGELEPVELEVSSLQIFGNVVLASEGVTVRDEVLGDGDATDANQAFQLAQPPSFFRDAPRPRSRIEIRVQRQTWEEVDRLAATTGESRVYRLELDEEGRATVIFGDGEAGARLPSGTGNVTATYTTGMSDRQVPPGGVSLLITRPLGLDSVFNPLPSTPGAPPEGPEELRRLAPRSIRMLDRIVALSDYEDFAVEFPGVAKAGAWSLIVGGAPAVQITVAAPGGVALEPTSGLIADLRSGIEAIRDHPAPVYIQSYTRVEIALDAKVRLLPGFDWLDVEGRIRRVLAERFGFEASSFGGGMSGAAVVNAIQGVRGVSAVDLDRFAWPGFDGKGGVGHWEYRAKPAYWDAEQVRLVPAELVLHGRVDLSLGGAP